MNDRVPIKRCAVYTRKSREDGLEQAFNSLDAQREAAEAFVASQRANGWTLLPDRYDDGGFSGGNTDRPGLKKLLEDVRAGKIDVVAVYKIDRLSRSLFDFADLLSEFEKHGVSFVSTTQLIDTSTPMGRMMLGILMTFAQYEREVIAERIRDKISATKKKGMWVGGRVPFGYRVENHKLVPGPVEAERVRFLFKRYVECGSPTLVAREMNAKGWKTRVGNPWVAQTVRKTLVQHVYVGKVFYKGEVYEGEHEAIVDEAVWKEARRMATENPPPPRRLRIGDPDARPAASRRARPRTWYTGRSDGFCPATPSSRGSRKPGSCRRRTSARPSRTSGSSSRGSSRKSARASSGFWSNARSWGRTAWTS